VTWWDAGAVDGVALNKAAIIPVSPAEQAQAWLMDASVVPYRGQQTAGLDRCWNGRHRRPAQGLARSALAGLDITDHCASGLRVEPTPLADQARGAGMAIGIT
jgi:hypothetical protein